MANWDSPERKRERSRQWREKIQAIIRAAKSVPCVDCHIQYPYWIMQFDHVPERGEKRFQFGDGGKKTITQVLEEIAKCDVVCANCGADRTHRRSHGDS